jgi:hypothetical protein
MPAHLTVQRFREHTNCTGLDGVELASLPKISAAGGAGRWARQGKYLGNSLRRHRRAAWRGSREDQT